MIIGLNGFGRIGRAFTRIATERGHTIGLINVRKSTPQLMAYLLQYDSVYRRFSRTVSHEESALIVDKTRIPVHQADAPEEIPWEQHNVDIVVDATGAFLTTEDLKKHIKGSVQKVLLTAPSKDETTPHVVLGVNDAQFDWSSPVVSNASCTTNCAAPLLKALMQFGIEQAMLTTTHAMTATQSLLDDANKNEARSRAAGLSIVPTTTGAADAVSRVLPELKGKIDGLSLRVPVPVSSFTDVTAVLSRNVTVEELDSAYRQWANGPIIGYSSDILVSSDFIGSSYSCVYDPHYTKVIDRMVKVTGWYDNEWGYSTRLVDVVERMSA